MSGKEDLPWLILHEPPYASLFHEGHPNDCPEVRCHGRRKFIYRAIEEQEARELYGIKLAVKDETTYIHDIAYLKELKEENERLRKALEHFSEEKRWKRYYIKHDEFPYIDGWNFLTKEYDQKPWLIAQEALQHEEIKEIENE